jgi:hypothetical protein
MKPMAKPVALALIAALGASTFQARAATQPTFLDGTALWARCGYRSDGPAPSECVGYVMGVHDAAFNVALQTTNQQLRPGMCLGMGETSVPAEQATDVVRRYLQQHPEGRNVSGANIVLRALVAAFPCAETPAKSG